MKWVILYLMLLVPNLTNENPLITEGEFIIKNNKLNKNIEQYHSFLKALGKRESGNKYDNDRNMPYWGYYQIGPMVRKTLHVSVSWQEFKQDSIYQDSLMYKNLIYNKERITKEYFNYFIGKEINGIVITYSGILASAHIGGGGGVRKYLYSNGRYNPKDRLNTSIADYMKLFAGYEFDLDSL